jgi:ketosteroid isomerase-like protein
MAHPDQELIQGGYEAFARGDVPDVLARFSEEIVWHIPGRSRLAGDYRGQDEVVGFFGTLMELSGGTFRLDIHDILATDGHVVALVRGHAEREGRQHSFDAAHVWHVADGKATEFWGLSTDPYADDEFWG